jgi:hypothetical protein
LLGILVAAGLCGFFLTARLLRKDVTIFVDNTGPEPLEVTVDGSPEGIAEPGVPLVIRCRSGARHIQIRRGDDIVFDEVKTLERPDQRRERRYLLNPEGDGRYATYQVKYSDGSFEVDPNKVAPKVGPFLGIPGARPPSPDEPEETARRLRQRYAEVAGLVKLLPAAPWLDVSACDYVLKRAPETVRGFIRETRTVLARLSGKDYALLKAAPGKRQVSAEELRALARTVDRVMDPDSEESDPPPE